MGENQRIHANSQEHLSISDTYVTFDSWTKSSKIGNSIYFDIFRDMSSASVLTRATGVDTELKNIFEIEIHTLRIPAVVANNYGLAWIHMDRITNNSIITVNAEQPIVRHHFEMNVDAVTTTHWTISPFPKRERYIFHTSLYDISSIGFTFFTPDRTIPLPEDVLFNTIFTPGSNPAEFTYPNHGLNNGDVVLFRKSFQSGVTAVDMAINNPDGLAVTVVDPNIFTVAVDASAVAVVTSIISTYVVKNRILIPLRFRGQTSDTTTPIVPV